MARKRSGNKSLSVPKDAASVLTALLRRRAKNMTLTKGDVQEIELVIGALHRVTSDGRTQAARLSKVPNLIPGYNMATKTEREDERAADPWEKLKAFVMPSNGKRKGRGYAKIFDAIPSTKKLRRSERERTVTPEMMADEEVRKLFDGQPPYPDKIWMKDTLCSRMKRVETLIEAKVIDKKEWHLKRFLESVLRVGKTTYKSDSGIYTMYNKWKSSNCAVAPVGRGRPSIMLVEDATEATKQSLTDRSSKSSTFQLKGMKNAYAEAKKDQAEKDGLERESVDCHVSNPTAKAAMVAVAMKNPDLGLTRKKLLNKTEKRFQAEHSPMAAKAYALTCLSTHFVEGHRPRNLAKFDPKKLSKSAQQTIEWVKEAYGAEEIHPVDPNLVLSTDDTTVFVYEGTSSSAKGEDDWDWKLIDKTSERSSVRSDFEVSDNDENSGGLRIRLTFTFTASGLAAPPYVAVSGLTDDELSPSLCPDGILAAQIPGLCKGGDDIFSSGFGWLVFLRADKKGTKSKEGDSFLSIANKKFIHYNDEVLLPFIRSIREKLGWKKGTAVPDYLKACSWFDGDIGQLQTMLYEAREALDEAEKICRNKHSAASTGTQQPCDLSPVFRLLKYMQSNMTAKDDVACGLSQTIHDYFSNYLRVKGLNLDGNPRKKKALIDFLLCLPEILEGTMKKKHIKRGFIEAGMVDEETGCVPVYDKLMGTCKRWVSASKDIGIPKEEKENCRGQFQHLMKIQMANGQVSYEDMIEAGIPRDIASDGSIVEYIRPSGADAEHRQPAKTINAERQKRLREEKRRRKASAEYAKAVRDRNTIIDILKRNGEVEEELLAKRQGITLEELTIKDFMHLKKPQVKKLKAFIHARKFDGANFRPKDVAGVDGKLNLVRHSGQSAESIEADCSFQEPCLVWLAWKLRSANIVLSARDAPVLDVTVQLPQFAVVHAGPSQQKRASDYLSDKDWVLSFEATVKGRISTSTVTTAMKINADKLESSLSARLSFHVSGRVHQTKQQHWTINRFTPDNLAPMAAAMCMMGHIVDRVERWRMDECLLSLPMHDLFPLLDDEDGDKELGKLEGCYLFFDWEKMKWIRSGKTSGTGKNACFSGRMKQHYKNAASKDQMREHPLYAKYPAKDVENLGSPEGIFDDLLIYCGMAFDSKASVSSLCSHGKSDSLFVWDKEVMDELKKKGGQVRKVQLDAVAYLWEICYDLLLAEGDNVSASPGFEALGLRVNRAGTKRKSYD